MEYAACHTSEGVKRLLFGLRPGMTEQDAVRLLQWPGFPMSCHMMLSSGERATYGLLSPTDRVIERGDRFTVAYGLWGALDCRAGFVAQRRRRPAARDPRLREQAGGTVLRGRGQVARGPARRPDRRRAPGHHRRAAGGPVLRHLPHARTSHQPRRVAPLSHRPSIHGTTPVGHGHRVGHHPGHRHGLLHHQRGEPLCPCRRRLAGRAGAALPVDVGAHPGPSHVRAPRSSGSSSTRTCCPSPTCPPTWRHSCCGPSAR